MRLTYMDITKIEEQVKILLDGYGYNSKIDSFVDIVDFVQKKGFEVAQGDLEDADDGFLAIRPKKLGKAPISLIAVNINRTVEYKRFVIAHEFAHYALHYKVGEVILHRENKKGKNQEENDADYFAAALLMPKDSFVRKYQEIKNNSDLTMPDIFKKLATIYEVPYESVVRRYYECCEG